MKLILLTVLTLVLVSCNNTTNPYPSGHQYSPDYRQPRQVDDALSYDIPDRIKYNEGVETLKRFKISVPEPGTPEVWINDLPSGATFDDKKMVISWEPNYDQGNDPNDPSIKVRSYPVVVWIRSSVDNIKAESKVVTLEVHDTPRSFIVDGTSSKTIYEGQEGSYAFDIENPDYPNGPFNVSLSNFPANAKLEKLSETSFKVVMTPDHFHTNVNQRCGSTRGCSAHEAKILVSNPANHLTDHKVEIRVSDRRLNPKLVVPETSTHGLDLSFQVVAYDTNREVAPRLEMSVNRPSGGHFTFSTQENTENFSTVLTVNWNDIPPTFNGKNFTFSFEACVKSSSSLWRNCETKTTNLNIVVRDRLAPTITRSSWPSGEIKYLRFNEYQVYSLRINDPEAPGVEPVVEIRPESMKKFVRYVNGSLRVKVDQPGFYEFDVIAKSAYNISTAESFIMEVFKKDRKKTLLFADSTRDDEVQFYKSMFNDFDIMNPAIQDLNTRNVSGRENLIITTSTLLDPSIKAKMEEAVNKIENIVITSPLIENLPENLLREINQDYGVSIMGRYSDLTHLPNIKTMELVTRRDFKKPKNSVFLKLTTTQESRDPLLFSTGVDTNNCESVIELASSNRAFRAETGIICDRPNGGRLALMGAEFADLNVTTPDATIPTDWLRKMLTTRLNNKERK
jgi:hypothetical protein